jgi:hypothetical protein
VVRLDPATGAIKQQMSFEPARGQVQTRLVTRGFTVFPLIEELRRGGGRTSGLRMESLGARWVVELGGRVWALGLGGK